MVTSKQVTEQKKKHILMDNKMDVYMREIKVPYRRDVQSPYKLEKEYTKRTLTPTLRDSSPEPGSRQEPFSVRTVQYIQGLPWGARCSSAHYVQRHPWSGNHSEIATLKHPLTLREVKKLMHREIQFFHGKDSRFQFPAVRGMQSLTHKPKIGSAWNCKNEAFRQMYQSSTFQPRYRILTKETVIQSSSGSVVK